MYPILLLPQRRLKMPPKKLPGTSLKRRPSNNTSRRTRLRKDVVHLFTRRSERLLRLKQLQHLLGNSEHSKLFSDDIRALIWLFVWEGEGLYVVEHCRLDEPRINVVGVYKRLNGVRNGAPGACDAAWAFGGQAALTYLSYWEWCWSWPVHPTIRDMYGILELKLHYSTSKACQGEEVVVRVRRHRAIVQRHACVVLQEPSDVGWRGGLTLKALKWASQPNIHCLRAAQITSRENVLAAVRKVFQTAARDADGNEFWQESNEVNSEYLFGAEPVVSGSRSPSFGKRGLMYAGDERCAGVWSKVQQPNGSFAFRFRLYNPASLKPDYQYEMLVWSENHQIQ